MANCSRAEHTNYSQRMTFGQPILIGASCCLLAKLAAVQDSDHFRFGDAFYLYGSDAKMDGEPDHELATSTTVRREFDTLKMPCCRQ